MYQREFTRQKPGGLAMCGIVGYVGQRKAQPLLLNSLAKLEYRGYDSCGIAVANPHLTVYKDAVRVDALSGTIPGSDSTIGIGHTRWATHGAPCQMNAHPHADCQGRIAVVHNGVISNYQKLRKQLALEGHRLASETDTEVIPHLIEKHYQANSYSNNGARLETAVKDALKEIEGSYAIIVLMEGEPELVFARKESPLVIGVGDRENFIASDIPAVLEYTSRVIYLEDGDIGSVTSQGIKISQDGQEVKREIQKILWTPEQSQKGGYEHYLLKEIHEQPRVIRDTLTEYLSGVKAPVDFDNLSGTPLLIACGTSFNAGLVGKYLAERLMNLSFRTELASEFNYFYNIPFVPVAIGISQSGETADTLKALRRLKEAKSKVIAITNVVGSTASKIADYTMYTRAGPEISVAATKSFTAQLIALYWLLLSNAKLDTKTYNDMVLEFRQIPDKIQQVLAMEETIAAHAIKLAEYQNVFYIGRGINYPIAMEGALKLKEISYIHSEAYAAGEIKHGPFALLSQDTPVVAIVGSDNSHDAMLTSIKEIKARGSPVFVISEEEDETVADLADYIIPAPSTNNLFSPLVYTVIVQLIAYFAARYRQCPIDFPRNLAKSVTVE
jgi:glutamine---fructose-6-phosphate transaminase (isomerizing)